MSEEKSKILKLKTPVSNIPINRTSHTFNTTQKKGIAKNVVENLERNLDRDEVSSNFDIETRAEREIVKPILAKGMPSVVEKAVNKKEKNSSSEFDENEKSYKGKEKSTEKILIHETNEKKQETEKESLTQQNPSQAEKLFSRPLAPKLVSFARPMKPYFPRERAYGSDAFGKKNESDERRPGENNRFDNRRPGFDNRRPGFAPRTEGWRPNREGNPNFQNNQYGQNQNKPEEFGVETIKSGKPGDDQEQRRPFRDFGNRGSETGQGPQREFQPRFNADGTRREFQPRFNADGTRREFQPRFNADGTRREFQPRFNADGTRREFQPRFNADGTRREFQPRFNADGTRREFQPRFNADGTRREFQPRFNADGTRREFQPRFNADGTKREFQPRFNADGTRREFQPRFNADGTQREFQPRFNADGTRREFQPRFNADGTRREFQPRFNADGTRREFQPRFNSDGPRREFQPRDGQRRPGSIGGGGRPFGAGGTGGARPDFSKPTKMISGLDKSKEDRRRKKGDKERPEVRSFKAAQKDEDGNVNINVSDFVGRVDTSNLEVEASFKSEASKRRAKEKIKRKESSANVITREVIIAEPMPIKEVASRMSMRVDETMKIARRLGVFIKEDDLIDEDTIQIIVEECGHTPVRVDERAKALLEFPCTKSAAKMVSRPPVVVIVGHVDHGKTSLLDKIRKTNVTAGEAGGITQHIGAYQVKVNEGTITFIDTPGHEAFTAMRARGVKSTDIAILVVAADESVKPQTIEAIQHLKAANSPIIVAITKCDKYEANPEKVKQDLLTHEIVAEEFGGNVSFISVSAQTGQNIEELLKLILLQAEVLDLKAEIDVDPRGCVLEAKVDPKRGPLATLLVQHGVLKKSMFCIAGTSSGKIKSMVNDKGEEIKEAYPSTPVEIMGLDTAPEAGSMFGVVSDMKKAEELLEARKDKEKDESKISIKKDLSLFGEKITDGLNLILRADTHGSLEALKAAILKIKIADMDAKIVLSGIGAPRESDIDLAVISNATILAFNVQPPSAVKKEADNQGIRIMQYKVIYHMIEELEKELSGLLKPKEKEVILGTAKIQHIFSFSKVGKIAGCLVTDGLVRRNARARLVRNGAIVYDSVISSLKRNKDDAREVANGLECGMTLDKFNDLAVGDEIVCYKIELE